MSSFKSWGRIKSSHVTFLNVLTLQEDRTSSISLVSGWESNGWDIGFKSDLESSCKIILDYFRFCCFLNLSSDLDIQYMKTQILPFSNNQEMFRYNGKTFRSLFHKLGYQFLHFRVLFSIEEWILLHIAFLNNLLVLKLAHTWCLLIKYEYSYLVKI